MDLHDRPRRAALALAGAGIALFITGVMLDTARWASTDKLAVALLDTVLALLLPAYVFVQAARHRPLSTTLVVQPRTIDRWLAIVLVFLCLVTLLFTFVLATGALPTVQPGSTLSQVGRYLTVLGLAFGIIGALLLQRWWVLKPRAAA